jgi:hypothetical protein
MTFLTHLKTTIQNCLPNLWLVKINRLAFFVPLIVLIFVYFLGLTEPAIRWAGGFLQLLGVLTVACDINNSRLLGYGFYPGVFRVCSINASY